MAVDFQSYGPGSCRFQDFAKRVAFGLRCALAQGSVEYVLVLIGNTTEIVLPQTNGFVQLLVQGRPLEEQLLAKLISAEEP